MRRLTGLIAAVATALGGCGSPSSPDPSNALVDDAPLDPIVHEVYTSFGKPARFIVRNEGQWAEAWSRAYAGRSEVPPRPSIDFSGEMVVVAAQGAQGSSGYDISITQAADKGGTIAFEVTSTSPASDCVVLAVITAPVTMVLMPASTKPVRFIEQERIRSCGR